MEGSNQPWIRKTTSPRPMSLNLKRKTETVDMVSEPKYSKSCILESVLLKDLELSPEQENIHKQILEDLNLDCTDKNNKASEDQLPEKNEQPAKQYKSKEYISSSDESDTESHKDQQVVAVNENITDKEDSENKSETITRHEEVSEEEQNIQMENHPADQVIINKKKTEMDQLKSIIFLEDLPENSENKKRKYKKRNSFANVCEYIHKKGTKKGTKCAKTCKHKLCSTHTKPNKEDTDTKFGKNLNEKIMSLQEKIKKMSEKLEFIEKNKTEEKMFNRKLYKLNKTLKYKLIGYSKHGKVILKSNEKIFNTTVPKDFPKPEVREDITLMYDEKAKKFFWHT